METTGSLLRYGFVALAWLAGVEWLLGRAISRLAASPVLDGPARTAIEALGAAGLFLLAPASLLAALLLFVTVIRGGSQALKEGIRSRAVLMTYLGIFGIVSVTFAAIQRAAWLSISYVILAALALGWVAVYYALRRSATPSMRVGLLLVAGAYGGYLSYLLLQELGRAGQPASLPPIVIRDLGEVCLVAAPFFFFAAISVPYRQWARPARWLLPTLLALAFSMANIVDMIANQGFTGVFAIWSIGLSYFLPWPLYAFSLALYVYSVLTCFARTDMKSPLATKSRAIGLLLLTFASYELQFPYQYVLALLSLLLLSGLVEPFGILAAPENRPGPMPHSEPFYTAKLDKPMPDISSDTGHITT